MPNLFTFVFPFRDREIMQVKRCLDSLKNQTLQNFSVIVVDFGSREEIGIEVRKLMADYAFCRLLTMNTYGRIWCKPEALNAGIVQVTTPFTITTDIDMVFSPGFMTYISSVANLSQRLFMQCHYIPENLLHLSNDQVFSLSPAELDNLEISEKDVAFGGFQCTATKTLMSIGGYDHFYTFWGAEDNDINKRLELTGQERVWADPKKSPYFHIWHPKVSNIPGLANPKGWNNYLHLYKNLNNTVVRNTGFYHNTAIPDQRPVHQYMSSHPSGDIRFMKTYPATVPILKNHFQINMEFQELKKGEVILIRYINRDMFSRKAFSNFALRLLESLRWRFKIDLNFNKAIQKNENLTYLQAKDNLLWLILDLIFENNITDYHILYDEYELTAYLMK